MTIFWMAVSMAISTAENGQNNHKQKYYPDGGRCCADSDPSLLPRRQAGIGGGFNYGWSGSWLVGVGRI